MKTIKFISIALIAIFALKIMPMDQSLDDVSQSLNLLQDINLNIFKTVINDLVKDCASFEDYENAIIEINKLRSISIKVNEQVTYVLSNINNRLKQSKFEDLNLDFKLNILFLVAQKVNKKIIEFYIKAQTNVEIRYESKKKETPLFLATSNRHNNFCKILLKYNANIFADVGFSHAVFCAINSNNLELVKLFIEHAGKLTEDDKFWFIGNATSRGFVEIVDYLIENNYNDNEKPEYFRQALSEAASQNHYELALFLINKGIPISNPVARDTFGPLSMACLQGYFGIVKLFLDRGADVNEKTKTGETPLMFAARSGNTQIIEMLIKKGAKIDEQDDNGKTALMYAAQENKIAAVDLLISFGVNVNIEDKRCYTALMYAYDNQYIFNTLKSKNAQFGKDLFDLGIRKVNVEMVKKTVKEEAAKDTWKEKCYTSLSMLLLNDICNIKGPEKDIIDVVKILLEHCPDVNYVGKRNLWHGSSYLILAVFNGMTEIVKLLIDKYKANLNFKNDEGETALIYAVKHPQNDIVTLLLENGAAINLRNNKNQNALDIAIESKKRNIDLNKFCNWSIEPGFDETIKILKFFSPGNY